MKLETNFEIKAVSLYVYSKSSDKPLMHGCLSDISFKFQQRVGGFKVSTNFDVFLTI